MKNREFIDKLLSMIEDFPNHIHWINRGKQIRIQHLGEIEETVLVNYFRHQHYNSFIRQLNLYGFRLCDKSSFHAVYDHPVFKLGNEQNYHKIQRKDKMLRNKRIQHKLNKSKTSIFAKIRVPTEEAHSNFSQAIDQIFSYHQESIKTMNSLSKSLVSLFDEIKSMRSPKIKQCFGRLKNMKEACLDQQIQKGKKIIQGLEEYSICEGNELYSECPQILCGQNQEPFLMMDSESRGKQNGTPLSSKDDL